MRSLVRGCWAKACKPAMGGKKGTYFVYIFYTERSARYNAEPTHTFQMRSENKPDIIPIYQAAIPVRPHSMRKSRNKDDTNENRHCHPEQVLRVKWHCS